MSGVALVGRVGQRIVLCSLCLGNRSCKLETGKLLPLSTVREISHYFVDRTIETIVPGAKNGAGSALRVYAGLRQFCRVV